MKPPGAAEVAAASALELAAIALVTALATALLATLARRLGWLDAAAPGVARKLQQEPVPAVGGAALLIGLVAAELLCSPLRSRAALGDAFVDANVALVALALAGAFGLGFLDDRLARGLSPLAKLAGQALVGVVLALAVVAGGGSLASATLLGCAAVLAQNAVNTFDNADGAATALALVGLAPVALPWAAALAGFLPFNLWLRRTRGRGPAGTPQAYLGDAGSHLLGVLLLVSPGGWVVLALPVLDLARLACVRTARGSRAWIGDRRHLAHRLIAAGCTRTFVVFVVVLAAAPPVIALVVAGPDPVAGLVPPSAGLWLGWAASAVCLALVVRATPAPE